MSPALSLARIRPFLDQLRALGIGCTFLTNNSSRSSADYLAHLRIAADPAMLDGIRRRPISCFPTSVNWESCWDNPAPRCDGPPHLRREAVFGFRRFLQSPVP